MKKFIYFLIILVSLPIVLSGITFVLKLLVGLFGLAVEFVDLIVPVAMICLFALLIWGLLKMRKDYRMISSGQKSNYWTIITNMFLVLFTFWMGIFVQDLIANKNSKLNDRLLRVQYVDKIRPDLLALWENEAFSTSKEYLSMMISCDIRKANIEDSIKIHPEQTDSLNNLISEVENENNAYLKSFNQFLSNHKKELIEFGYISDSLMSKYAYYDADLTDTIQSVSLELRMALYTAEIQNDSTLLESVQFLKQDSVSKFNKLQSYYSHKLSSPKHQLASGNFQHDLKKGATLATLYYGFSACDSLLVYREILKGCTKNTMLMQLIMAGENNRNQGLQNIMYNFFIFNVLKNPITTFFITILLSIIVCALLSKIISPATVKSKEDAIKSLDADIQKYKQQLQTHIRACNNSEHTIITKDIEIQSLKQQNELLQAQLAERNQVLASELSLLSSLVQQSKRKPHKKNNKKQSSDNNTQEINSNDNEQETNI